jgi:hypothetical protein
MVGTLGAANQRFPVKTVNSDAAGANCGSVRPPPAGQIDLAASRSLHHRRGSAVRYELHLGAGLMGNTSTCECAAGADRSRCLAGIGPEQAISSPVLLAEIARLMIHKGLIEHQIGSKSFITNGREYITPALTCDVHWPIETVAIRRGAEQAVTPIVPPALHAR